MKIYIILLLMAFMLGGCISSLKNDYPEIQYYTLGQEPSTLKSNIKIDASLLIMDFSVNENLQTDMLISTHDNIKVTRYYYSRWITDYSSTVTDFFVNRYNSFGGFTGGVLKSTTILQPNYIMESHLLTMMANNVDEEGRGENNVEVKIQMSLVKTLPQSTGRPVLFSDLYYVKVPRSNNSVTSIVPAFSQAMSQIADKIYSDIIQAVSIDHEAQPAQNLQK